VSRSRLINGKKPKTTTKNAFKCCFCRVKRTGSWPENGCSGIYEIASSNSRVVRFNPSNFAGTFASFGSNGTGSGQFFNPFGVAVDGAGVVYVADQSNNRVDSFNPSNFAGTFTSFGTQGTGNGQFKDPGSVAVDTTGHLFVSDVSNGRIVELSGVTPIPEPGTGALLGVGLVTALGWRRRMRGC